MTNTTSAIAFKSGPLKRTDFTSEQERANAFAEALIGSTSPSSGDASPSAGGTAFKSTSRLTLESGLEEFDTGRSDLDTCIVNLTSPDVPPTAGILCISGAKVIFTEALPTANYKLVITSITVS